MSNLLSPREVEELSADIPEVDIYMTALPTERTANFIFRKLLEDGAAALQIAYDSATAINTVFVLLPKARRTFSEDPVFGSYWQGGQGNVYVSLERASAFAFHLQRDIEVHPSYVHEKLRLGGDEPCKNMANLLNFLRDKIV